MSSSGISPIVPPPPGAKPPVGAQAKGGQDVEARLIALILAALVVNAGVLGNYRKKVWVAEHWLKSGNGIGAAINAKNPGEVTNKQWEAFYKGYQALAKLLKELKAEPNPSKETKAMIKNLETIVDNPGVKKLMTDLAALLKAEHQQPIDYEKVDKLVKKTQKDLSDIQNPTTPEGKRLLTKLQDSIKDFVAAISNPAKLLAQQAMGYIRNIKTYATALSNWLKKFEQSSELIFKLTLR